MNYIQDKLLESRFQFYLTGSKYFGYDTDKSDIDYMVQYTPELIGFLESLGFKENKNLKFRNKYLMYLYKNEETDIDIQVVKNVYSKLKAQEFIKKWLTPEEVQKIFSKSVLAFKMWDLMIDLVEADE